MHDKPYRVIALREEARYDVNSRASFFYRVSFMVGPPDRELGPFHEDFPKETYSEFAVDQALRAKAQSLLALL